jgi:hypothetical protein
MTEEIDQRRSNALFKTRNEERYWNTQMRRTKLISCSVLDNTV